MSVIPGAISFDNIKEQPKEPQVTKRKVTNEVPKQGSDFFIKGEDRMQELESMEYEIGGFTEPKKAVQTAPAPAPIQAEPAKPAKKKRVPSQKQLEHLARMREKKAAMKKAAPAPAPAPAPVKVVKSDDEKAAKRARKRAEMKQYFEELYGEKEKIRQTEKQKRRAQKQEIYQKMIATGQISIGKSAPAPAPAPAPVPVVPLGRKRVRWNGGMLETYYE